MEVQEFKLQFKWQHLVKEGSCQRMQVYKVPHIRVVVPKTEQDWDIFIFYEVNEPGKKYFWFPLYGNKELYAKAIASALEGLQQS